MGGDSVNHSEGRKTIFCLPGINNYMLKGNQPAVHTPADLLMKVKDKLPDGITPLFEEHWLDGPPQKWIDNKLTAHCSKHGKFTKWRRDMLKNPRCQKCSNEEKSIKMKQALRDGTAPDGFAQSARAKMPESMKGYNSRGEINWINSFNNPNIKTGERVYLSDGSYIKPDGVDYESRTIYEYWGSYWHGDPRYIKDMTERSIYNNLTFQELYDQTQMKRQKILDNGWHLEEVWELDWWKSE